MGIPSSFMGTRIPENCFDQVNVNDLIPNDLPEPKRHINVNRERDRLRLHEFCRRVLVLGEVPAKAAAEVGWPAPKAYRLMQKQTYWKMREEIIAEYNVKSDS